MKKLLIALLCAVPAGCATPTYQPTYSPDQTYVFYLMDDEYIGHNDDGARMYSCFYEGGWYGKRIESEQARFCISEVEFTGTEIDSMRFGKIMH